MDERALEDWYASQDEPKKKRGREDDSTFNFLLNEKRRVRRFVSKLTDMERVVVYLRFWENLLASEIATLVGISEGKIEKILVESVKKLRANYILELTKAQTLSNAFV